MTEREVLALRAAYVKGVMKEYERCSMQEPAWGRKQKETMAIGEAEREFPRPPAKVWRCRKCNRKFEYVDPAAVGGGHEGCPGPVEEVEA